MTDYVSVRLWHVRSTYEAMCFSANEGGPSFWIPRHKIASVINGVDGECAISIPRSLAMKLKLRIYA